MEKIAVNAFALFASTLKFKMTAKRIDGYIISQEIMTELIEETKEELTKTWGKKCSKCEGTGIVLVANGADDYDKEVCECKMK